VHVSQSLYTGDLYVGGNKQFNVGTFQSDLSQSGSAGVSQSMQFEVTDISQGVSIVSGSQITAANAGTYNIQFSAQIDRVSGSGTDTVNVWLKKNGTNVPATAGAITISGAALEAKTIAAWNYVVDVATNDYYELCWQTTDTNIHLTANAASGNVPSIPSIILTVTQVR
jgi:PKD repeat protein